VSCSETFEFRRGRGVVWVCDIIGSSKHLNSDKTADAFEAFLPRLNWLARTVVRAAGGTFIKWTGDGFLAWFETPLHREVTRQGRAVLNALWHLTVFVNVTRLAVSSNAPFKINHGVTYEQDALLTTITYPSGHRALDLIGRSVVLAFRLSSVPAPFPGVSIQQDIAMAYKESPTPGMRFRRWCPSTTERMKYFKGERWGTRTLYISDETKKRKSSLLAMRLHAKKAIELANGAQPDDDDRVAFAKRFAEEMMGGPEWARTSMVEYSRYIDEDLLGALKAVVAVMETLPGMLH
jgi:class 3 adenylate cyclase